MATIRYRLTETATYEFPVEIDDDIDPDSDEAREAAEAEFCNFADPNEHFVEVSERDIERIEGNGD